MARAVPSVTMTEATSRPRALVPASRASSTS